MLLSSSKSPQSGRHHRGKHGPLLSPLVSVASAPSAPPTAVAPVLDDAADAAFPSPLRPAVATIAHISSTCFCSIWQCPICNVAKHRPCADEDQNQNHQNQNHQAVVAQHRILLLVPGVLKYTSSARGPPNTNPSNHNKRDVAISVNAEARCCSLCRNI